MSPSNLEILYKYLQKIEHVSYFVLPAKESANWVLVLRTLFRKLKEEIGNEKLPEFQAVFNLLCEDRINEYKLAKNLHSFLLKLYTKSFDQFSSLLDNIEKRSLNFWMSEEQAYKMRISKERVQVVEHDVSLLQNEMQLYALDYFFSMQKWFATSDNKQKLVLIFYGKNNLPSLKDDALEDDMLDKVVYQMWDWRLKVKMVNDYFDYKKSFVNAKKEHISDKQLVEIEESLRRYCKQLLDISIQHGIQKIENGLLLPYGNIYLNKIIL
ncbi:MAG: hypothetical protein WCW16_02505 [Candidatus Magasanikbacteria bacterium]